MIHIFLEENESSIHTNSDIINDIYLKSSVTLAQAIFYIYETNVDCNIICKTANSPKCEEISGEILAILTSFTQN